MSEQTKDELRRAVREEYAVVARDAGTGPGAGPGTKACAPSCCGGAPSNGISAKLGYSDDDLANAPEGADMGLGCGNPQAIAALKPGETVLDLGAGGGFDCFLAAKRVGPTGHVIGVDMTAEMLSKARANAAKLDTKNVEFRLGEIENLPVADGTIDVILSNCVINLSPDKAAVYRDAYRVLKPGGRLAISDVVAIAPIPTALAQAPHALASCVAGAVTRVAVEELVRAAGFDEVSIRVVPESRGFIADWLPGSGAEDYIASATIEAVKPGGAKTCCEPTCCASGASA